MPVPGGQAWTFRSPVQLPFDPTQPAFLHAWVALGPIEPSGAPTPPQIVDIPLQLAAPGQTQELRLELHADRHHFCLRATDATATPPTGTLFASMQARNANGGMRMGGVGGGTGDTWADQLDSMGGSTPLTLTVWVAGPNHVTARAETTVLPGP